MTGDNQCPARVGFPSNALRLGKSAALRRLPFGVRGLFALDSALASCLGRRGSAFCGGWWPRPKRFRSSSAAASSVLAYAQDDPHGASYLDVERQRHSCIVCSHLSCFLDVFARGLCGRIWSCVQPAGLAFVVGLCSLTRCECMRRYTFGVLTPRHAGPPPRVPRVHGFKVYTLNGKHVRQSATLLSIYYISIASSRKVLKIVPRTALFSRQRVQRRRVHSTPSPRSTNISGGGARHDSILTISSGRCPCVGATWRP